METAVEFLERFMKQNQYFIGNDLFEAINQAKQIEKTNTDNKVIHFAEWLTKKHTLTLMALYEQFEEQFYNKKQQ